MTKEERFEVVRTRGGQDAVRDRRTGEVMHPIVGPAEESLALYVGPSRLAERLGQPGPPLVLLDVGLGAGSNAIAAWHTSARRGDAGRKLRIVSFDTTTDALRLALEHRSAFDLDGPAGQAAEALLGDHHHDTPHTEWSMILGDLPTTLEAAPDADIVFWDPFSPTANSELWNVDAFSRLRAVCAPGATVHTYSAATFVRSAMLLGGFVVGEGPPTAGKGKSTVAAVDVEDIERPLDDRWLERLDRSSAPLPADAPADSIATIRRHIERTDRRIWRRPP